jgi:hypothetical protein
MKVIPAAAIVSLLVLLLTWLSLRAINPEAGLFDLAFAALDRFAMLESALYRDVFTARAGTLRNYDPLVREINELHEWACMTNVDKDGTRVALGFDAHQRHRP